MSHYGLAGFGTATAYAEVLGFTEDAQKLKEVVKDIYSADTYSSSACGERRRSDPGLSGLRECWRWRRRLEAAATAPASIRKPQKGKAP